VVGAQRGDRRRVVAELAQDLVGVLAEQRCAQGSTRCGADRAVA
jgi:hypothetical protein